MIALKSFQFHEGPIKTKKKNLAYQACEGFNSMKVRLKPAPIVF